MASKRTDLLADLQKTKQQLDASEKRGRRAVQKARDLEKVLNNVKSRMQLWADSPLADEANAARVLTVGDCRKILSTLNDILGT